MLPTTRRGGQASGAEEPASVTSSATVAVQHPTLWLLVDERRCRVPERFCVCGYRAELRVECRWFWVADAAEVIVGGDPFEGEGEG
jgi:hypothetical protein